MRGLLIGCVLFLTGCNTVGEFQPDASLMQPCPPMNQLVVDENGKVSMGTLLLEDVALAGQYKECSERVDGWIKTYKTYSNNK
jgi:hypothetical protein